MDANASFFFLKLLLKAYNKAKNLIQEARDILLLDLESLYGIFFHVHVLLFLNFMVTYPGPSGAVEEGRQGGRDPLRPIVWKNYNSIISFKTV